MGMPQCQGKRGYGWLPDGMRGLLGASCKRRADVSHEAQVVVWYCEKSQWRKTHLGLITGLPHTSCKVLVSHLVSLCLYFLTCKMGL